MVLRHTHVSIAHTWLKFLSLFLPFSFSYLFKSIVIGLDVRSILRWCPNTHAYALRTLVSNFRCKCKDLGLRRIVSRSFVWPFLHLLLFCIDTYEIGCTPIYFVCLLPQSINSHLMHNHVQWFYWMIAFVAIEKISVRTFLAVTEYPFDQ